MVRGADQVVAAQSLQAFILPVGNSGGTVAVPAEPLAVELADDPGVTVLLLVGIDLVAAAQSERAKGRRRPMNTELIAGDAGEKAMESVVTVDVADVLADNDASSKPCDGGVVYAGWLPTVHTVDAACFIGASDLVVPGKVAGSIVQLHRAADCGYDGVSADYRAPPMERSASGSVAGGTDRRCSHTLLDRTVSSR
ncbi:MAG: hypothetical protein QOI90_753 [Mycobacterium sp.]|jgi:hypothetical protein|nr:hypothetical protein [Mycobacterium sp.]